MEIKTVTYSALGKKFYLKKALSSIPMDTHQETMLRAGWTVMSGPVFVPGTKAPGYIGQQRNRGSMVVTYQRG